MLSLVGLDDIHDLARFPRVHACASSGRLGKCATDAAGTRAGTSGTKIGHAPLQGAFSAAAVLCVRDHPAGQKFVPRLENKQRQGTAFTLLAHQLARAVYDMCKRTTAFDLPPCLQADGRAVGERNASLDSRGMTRFLNARPGVKPGVCERP